jgi:branched-chain amino acid transport system substrate-binding protein
VGARHRPGGTTLAPGVFLVAALASAAACAGSGPAPATSTIPATSAAAPRAADGVLTIGVLLPTAGAASTTARGLRNGIELAVAQINRDGGVLGQWIQVRTADEGAEPAATSLALDELLAAGADAIIGPLSARVAPLVAERSTNAGVVVCHPASAASARSPRPRGTVVTTMPTIAASGRALGRVLVETGARRVAVIAPADDYGVEIAGGVTAELRSQGIESRSTLYDARAPVPAEVAARTTTTDRPDAVAVVGNVEPGARVLDGLFAAGLRPPGVPVVVSEGFRQQELLDVFGSDTALDGVSLLLPQADATGTTFRDVVAAADPTLTRTWSYAAYGYDCVSLLAVAAEAARSDDPAVFGPRIVDSSRAGVSCTTVKRCGELTAEGRNIDLVGASGPLDLDDAGNPTDARFELHRFDSGGRTRLLRVFSLR